MCFDKQKQTWVKRKRPDAITDLAEGLGSIDMEDDLLEQIPDLSVNEVEELNRMKDNGKSPQTELTYVHKFDPHAAFDSPKKEQSV